MSMNVKQKMLAVHTPVLIMKGDLIVVVILDTCYQPMKLTALVRCTFTIALSYI